MEELTVVAAEENRLYIDLEGYETAADGDRLAEAVREAADRLSAGFEVVADYRGYRPAEPAAIDRLERIDRAIAADASATVRVLPGSVPERRYFEAVGRNGSDHVVATAESVEMATELLDRRRARVA